MSDNEVSVSRAALLALKRERDLIEMGHRFLDEKRMLLAREQLQRLAEWQNTMTALDRAQAALREAMEQAIAEYGLLDLQSHPAAAAASAEWTAPDASFLGLKLPADAFRLTATEPRYPPTAERPHADAVRERSLQLVELAGAAAAQLTAMLRLDAEYKRTERSVRALENVVMPEVIELQKNTEDALAELDQEEAVRVRLFARRRQDVRPDGDPGEA